MKKPEQAMNITIKLFASLRKGRFDVTTMEFPNGTTVGEIVHLLRIPEDEITLIFVNGRHQELTTVPEEGDTVSFFPAVGGG
jgi:molybdopterin converting factor small subunit